ncbi:MAG TPA: hypothetical protein VHC90_12340 [Bryobacteraceae bacterium]|nr:hypothetical protein [Bryobacteraceae bacterium]
MEKILSTLAQGNGAATNQNIYEATVEELPDQPGLQLTPGKSPIQLLMIDRAERPLAN